MTGLRVLLIDQVREYVERHYHEPISLRDVASALGYSRSHLTSVVRMATGKPVNAWIIERRIGAAQRHLADPHRSVAEVATTVGFGDTSHFSRKFKRIVGMTPSKWRTAHAGATSAVPACPKCGHAPLFAPGAQRTVNAAA
jgi:AraC-like DNA-binding protein